MFRVILARRGWILAAYLVILPAGILAAAGVAGDNSIASLIVESDPDYRDTRAFQRIFPEGKPAVLMVAAPDPFDPGVLAKVADLERSLAGVPGVTPLSALTLYDRVRPGGAQAPRGAEDFRRFARGTDLLGREGLVGSDFLGIAIDLRAPDAPSRDRALAEIDRRISEVERRPGAPVAVRTVGEPYVDAYMERETRRASLIYFPLFGVFVIALNLVLYRSLRTLAAFLATLVVAVSLTVAIARVTGFSFTIVSSLVPLTILVTCTAALVYIQSRFVEGAGSTPIEEHRVFTLANKFLPTTASILAAAIGFAALGISGIRPIREMGLWVAAGLLITWIVVFTLFPVLQRMFATPVLRRRTSSGRTVLLLLERLPRFTHRWRRPLLGGSLLLMLAGVLAVTGIPRLFGPMGIETDTLDYIDKDLPLYRDTRRFEEAISGLSVAHAWVSAPGGALLRPGVLRGLESFATEIEQDPRVGSVTGPTSILRWMRYVSGEGDRLPDDPRAWEGLTADLDRVLLEEPAARAFVDVGSLAHAKLTIVYRGGGFGSVRDLKGFLGEAWRRASDREPSLSSCRMKVVGQGLLEAKIAEYLVPTLTESLSLTVLLIFLAFLLVFRSPSARLIAMLPSLFAILVMFLSMRLLGVPLNVATILIASIVLGASENDQIHFFHHYLEARNGAGTEAALRHALHIAARGILFATFINAGGFLVLAFSGLPPMRQFGLLSSGAFVLSMIASLTTLPAALWIVTGDSPGQEPAGSQPAPGAASPR
jgi:uncharacterized protein